MNSSIKPALALLAALALASAAPSALAQGKGGGGQGAGTRQKQEQPMPQKRGPESKAPQRQEQAETGNRLRRELKDEDIYGHEMMSAEERDRYRDRLNAAAGDKEWAQARLEHQEEMRQRADAAGRSLEPPVYGQHMMSAEERQRFTERMQSASSDAERAEIREQHRETINERARALGVDPEGSNRGK
jgi:hypothetical protein